MAHENNDDEITIDFGKITKFFKKKKEKNPHQKLSEVNKPNIQTSPTSSNTTEKPYQVEEQKSYNVTADSKESEKEMDNKSSTDQDFKSTAHSDPNQRLKEKDDEISIDLSKVKSFFKDRLKSDSSQRDTTSQQDLTHKKNDRDDEISFDFSKIKNIFKKKEKFDHEPMKESDDDVSIDWNKSKDFFKKNELIIIPTILLLIAIFLSVNIRIQPAYLPITEDWAKDAVMNNLRNQIRSQINSQFPNLPSENKDSLVQNELDKVLSEQKSQIDQQIEATSNYFKSRLQTDKGQTYLLAIDPWFWLRHARNVINNGHPGDEIRDGVIWDTHMFAPEGRPVPEDVFHAYFEAYLFKFLSIFNKDLELIKVAFFVPVLLSALSVIPAFFITRRMGGNFGGFIAALIVAIHPAFLTRTAGGFADTDAYNILLPLLITWFFIIALESKTTWKSIFFSILAGHMVGIFSFAWGGWWFIFDFILISTVIYIAYFIFINIKNINNVLNSKEFKLIVISFILFIISSGIFTTIFRDYRTFIDEPFRNPIGFAKLKEVGIGTVWPNVFTTVAEQNPASLDHVISQIGLGKWLFLLIALMGVVLTLSRLESKNYWYLGGTLLWYIIIFIIRPQNLNIFLVLISIPIILRLLYAIIKRDEKIDIKYSIILIIWLTATIYASVKGIRFMLLLVPSFAVGFGIAFGQIYSYISNLITRGLNINKYISKIVIVVLLLLVAGIFPIPVKPYCLGATCDNAISTSQRELPSMNDAWYAALDKINKEATPDAIINSWWDFGHWFKYIGDRAVTFDGTSQNSPQAHWIGNSLLTSDEKTSVGILRMLDCSGYSGGTRAYNKILDVLEDEPKSVELLYEVIVVDRDEAYNIYKAWNLDDTLTNELLELTHCDPPENYYITSEDMVGKSGVWSHFGSWNFERALIYSTLKSDGYQNNIEKSTDFLKERFNYTQNEADDLYYEVESITNSRQANDWIAPWPGYAGTIGCSKIDPLTLSCSNFIVNLTTFDIFISGNGVKQYPIKASFQTDDDVIVKTYNESTITLQNGRGLGTALVKKGDSYTLLQMDEALAAGMFTRLFYMDGIGLRHFKKFTEQNSFTGGHVIVWKVDWEGKEKNIIPKVQEPVIEEELINQTNEEIQIENIIESNISLESELLNTTPDNTEVITNDSLNSSDLGNNVST